MLGFDGVGCSGLRGPGCAAGAPAGLRVRGVFPGLKSEAMLWPPLPGRLMVG